MTMNHRAAVLMLLLCGRAVAQQPSAAADKLLRLIPPDAHAAVVIPSVKRLSDAMTQCLEGMDRVQLVPGRPLDLVQSATGFNVGIDLAGGMAIVLTADQQQKKSAQPAFVVPVSDAQTFLQGNFIAHEGDSHRLGDGTTLYSKILGSHVVLSEDAAAARNYEPGEGIAASLTAALGQRTAPIMSGGEMVVLVREGGYQRLSRALKAEAARTGIALPFIAVWSLRVLDDADFSATSFHFDPLALIVRSIARFKPGSELDRISAGGTDGETVPQGLARLPNKPFYFAGSIDIAGLDGPRVIENLFTDGAGEPPLWLIQAAGAQFAAYPSPAGLAGGILNDAVLVIQTPHPADAKAFIQQHFLALKTSAPVEVKWEADKPVAGAGTADAYEVKFADMPPEMAQWSLVNSLIFGRAGWRGYVRAADDSVLITFSQRPAVLKAALDAAASPNGVAAMPAIKTMRTWMPANRDLELYIGVGQLGQLAGQIADSFGGLAEGAGAALPEIDASLPPLGIGLDVHEHRIESAAIIPAGVLAIGFDQAFERLSARAREPAADDEH